MADYDLYSACLDTGNRFLAPAGRFLFFNLLNSAVARPLQNARVKCSQTFGFDALFRTPMKRAIWQD